VILKLSTLSLPNTPSGRSQNAHWKLGQIAHGRVTSGVEGKPAVHISGSAYQLNSNLKLVEGESLLLKVSGVSPRIEFSLVARAQQNVGINDGVSIFLSDKILQNTTIADRNINRSLTNLISLLHTSSSSPIPSATAQLINSMRSRLLQADGLANPKLIESSMLGSSLLVGGSGHLANSSPLDGGLLGMLMQIVDSLANRRRSLEQLPGGIRYQQALGLSLYQNSDSDFLGKFTRDVEEQFNNLLNLRNKAQEDSQQQAYRLLVELPIVFRNQVSSVSIRLLEEKKEGEQGSESLNCSVEFEFELNSIGRLYTRILLLDCSVSLFIGCERTTTTDHFAGFQNSLEGRLSAYGLDLKEFQVAAHNGYLSPNPDSQANTDDRKIVQGEDLPSEITEAITDEATRLQLREVYAEGKMPELEEFTLRLNNHNVNVENEIPAHLYCAMACFFAQLFDTVKDQEILS